MIAPRLHRHRRGFQGQATAARHGVARIDHEVQNDLSELAGIDLGMHAFAALEIALHGNVFAQQAQERPLEIRQQRVHIHDRRRKRMFAAEREKLAGQRGGARRGPADLADVLRHLAFRFQFVEQEITVTKNGGEKIIEVVRDAAGELAKRFHFLRTHELVLELFTRRDVHERTHQLHRTAERIADDARALEQI